MEKWRLLAVGLCLFLACNICVGCMEVSDETAHGAGDIVVEVLPRPEDIDGKVAPIVGEALSPDGKWKVQQVGAYAGVTADGTYAPEAVQIIDVSTKQVVWEGIADHRQSVLWSPDSKYVAMSRTSRGYGYITLIETADWHEWDLTPPEGSNVPKHTFLPAADWGEWIADDEICLTIGRDGRVGAQTSYRCLLASSEESLSAAVLEQTTEELPGEYDFDHDGEPETVELTMVWFDGGGSALDWAELWVRKADGTALWKEDASTSHAGWNSVFALTIDDEDYLLRYNPYIGNGFGNYIYGVFYLGEEADGIYEVVYDEQKIEFDLYFHNDYQDFDPERIAAFLTDVHGYLNDNSTLLLSTEKGELRIGGSGAEFTDDFVFWDDNLPYDESLTLEENLQNYKDYMTELQAAEAVPNKSID